MKNKYLVHIVYCILYILCVSLFCFYQTATVLFLPPVFFRAKIIFSSVKAFKITLQCCGVTSVLRDLIEIAVSAETIFL